MQDYRTIQGKAAAELEEKRSRFIARAAFAGGEEAALFPDIPPLSALIFGLAHGNFDQFAYAFLSGVIFGLMAVRYDSIIPGMVLHLINNFFVTVITYQKQLTGIGGLWDGLVNAAAALGNIIVNISYFAAPFVAVLLAFCGAARLTAVGGENKHRKLLAIFSPVFMVALVVMLLQFN